jgi:hypothetical protein
MSFHEAVLRTQARILAELREASGFPEAEWDALGVSVESVRFLDTVDPRLALRRHHLNLIHTTMAGWPTREALPTTDPEDCA